MNHAPLMCPHYVIPGFRVLTLLGVITSFSHVLVLRGLDIFIED